MKNIVPRNLAQIFQIQPPPSLRTKKGGALKTSFLCVHMDFLPFTASPVISCFSKYQSGLYSLPKGCIGSLGGTMYRAGGRASTS